MGRPWVAALEREHGPGARLAGTGNALIEESDWEPWGQRTMPFWDRKKPEVAPVAKSLVLDRLLALNNPSNPFEIRRSPETDLFIEQRIVDEQRYKAWLLLDEATKEGRFCQEMSNKETETDVRVGTGGVGLSFGSKKTWSRGPGRYKSFGGEIGGGAVKKWEFDTKRVHDPIRDTLAGSGWAFRQGLT